MKDIIRKFLGAIGGLIIASCSLFLILVTAVAASRPREWYHSLMAIPFAIAAGSVLWLGLKITGEFLFSSDKDIRVARIAAVLAWIVLSGLLTAWIIDTAFYYRNMWELNPAPEE